MQKAKADEPFAPMIVADMLYDMEERDRLQSGHVNAMQVSGSIYSACRFFKMFQQTDLKSHISTKTPKAPVFNLPHETSVARMRRNDLAGARKQWLAEAKGESTENSQRQQSQFLTDTNHEGELINFHSLRHTCGAWLAMTGTRLNVVQQVMRHQTITLTMDTYGHLLPGQEADAVGRMRTMLVDHKSAPEALRATGTDTGCLPRR